MTARDLLQTQLERGIAELGLTLPAEAVFRLLDFQALLERWNGAFNLTAVRDAGEMITRHLLDSLAILPYVRGATLADLGTGPGLPGIVLAIAAPGREMLLVDSNGKKVRFLREAIRALKLDGVRAVQSRVEDVRHRARLRQLRRHARLGRPSAGARRHLAGDEGQAVAGRTGGRAGRFRRAGNARAGGAGAGRRAPPGGTWQGLISQVSEGQAAARAT
jgi:hypothetical protein